MAQSTSNNLRCEARSFLAEIRIATREAHAALDASLSVRDHGITKARYVAFLRGSYNAAATVEAGVREWFGEESFVTRVECIQNDLCDLGVTVDAEAARAQHEAMTFSSFAEAMGAAYVVEGSSLGGAVLAREIDSALALHGRALSYLRRRGEATGAHWKQFAARLDAWGGAAPAVSRAAACHAATRVFATYERALSGAGARADVALDGGAGGLQ